MWYFEEFQSMRNRKDEKSELEYIHIYILSA